MDIVMQSIDSIIPYEKNPRKNKKAIDYVKNSIKEFGFKNPIIVDKDNVIVAGHTRFEAAKKLKMTEVPTNIASDLTDEQIKAFRLADNKTAEFSSWNLGLLDGELFDIQGIDMELFGFSFDDDKNALSDTYSLKVKIPQYEPTGNEVELSELVDTSKSEVLIEEIEEADIPDDVKEFLKLGAMRHNVFNYRNIAEYYANASKEVQELFEKSALVIIDIDDAIANGYCTLFDEITKLRESE